MESYELAIIIINTGSGDDRPAKVPANVFNHGIGFTFLGFGVNIEPFLALFVNESFGLLKGISDMRMYFIQESSTEGITKESEIEMINPSPRDVVTGTAF